MKVTDDSLMCSIFNETIKHLPFRAIQRYVGYRVTMASDSQFKSAIRLLAANRRHVSCGLSCSQSLVRLRQLVELEHIKSDEKPARSKFGLSFWYWLPEPLMRPVWDRTREILSHCGLPDNLNLVLMPNSDCLAESISRQLAEEFSLVRRDTGAGTKWMLKSSR